MKEKPNIKTLREKSGLTQKAFADRYHIPVQTLKQWESDPNSTSHRTPPDYFVYILGKLFEYERQEYCQISSGAENSVLRAAEQSKNDAKLWLRYLRKEFIGGRTRLTPEQVAAILNSGKLTMYQRISLLRAIEPGTITNKYVLSLNEPAKTPILDAIRGGNNDDRK